MSEVVEQSDYAEIEKSTAISLEERKKQAEIKKIHTSIAQEILKETQQHKGSFLDGLLGRKEPSKEAPFKQFLTKVIGELSTIFPHSKGDGSINEKNFTIYRKRFLDIFDEAKDNTESYCTNWGFVPLAKEQTFKFKFNTNKELEPTKGLEEENGDEKKS